MLENFLGWVLVAMGLGTLTEGYHAFRQRTGRHERPIRYWWVAGALWALGLALIKLGLSVQVA